MLLDRETERQILDGLVDAAKSGLSGALVLYGEAGMGKTALLDYSESAAGQLRSARIVGIEPEQEFGYAALHRLLLPHLQHLDALPRPQRNALSSAFGMADRSPADPFLVGLATLTLLADIASSQGLLCIVDDAQWIDFESLQAIAFVGRRLGAEGMALLLGLRTSTEILPALTGLTSLEVGGLPPTAATDLLKTVIGDRFDHRVANHIVEETNGCPLALIELASELTDEQLIGTDQLSAPIPIARRLEEHFVRQIEALPRDSRTILLVAAAEAAGDTELVRKVAKELGCTEGAEEAVVRSRLLTTQPRTTFRHPLISSAVYAAASPADRWAVHHALTKAIDRDVNPDGWARHMTAITVRPDRELAEFLETTSQRVRDRGGFAAESSLLTQAAEFTEENHLQSARRVSAAVAAVNAGAPQRAERLLAKARSGPIDIQTMAEALRVEGRIRMQLARPKEAAALYVSAAKTYLPLDLHRARESMLEALDCYLITQHNTIDTDGAEIARMALSTANNQALSPIEDLLLDGASVLVAVGYTESVELLHRACRLLRNGPVSDDDLTRTYSIGMNIANALFDDQAYIAWIERVEGFARKTGALLVLQIALFGRTTHHAREGRLRIAEVTFQETVEIAAAIGMPVDSYVAIDVDVAAWRGDEQATRSKAQRLLEDGPAYGAAAIEFKAYYSLAVLELAAGRYPEALAAAEQITSRDAIGWREQALPLVVEAGVRCGNRAAAERAFEDLTVCALSSGTPWALGLLARSRALMADDDRAGFEFEASIGYLEQTLMRIDLMVTHLLYGEWLRRQTRLHEARVHLREAYEAFADMGAERFAERSRAELMATGEKVPRRTEDSMNNLTPQELRIAQMASRGATNPEIAAQLFISSSTVDYHLRKVYRKLDITSRRQLERALQPLV